MYLKNGVNIPAPIDPNMSYGQTKKTPTSNVSSRNLDRSTWISDTPPKFNIAEKWMVGRLLSYGEGNFSGAILNFGRLISQSS